jgi:hypothetical protein
MHRSGTSLVASAFRAAGIDVGSDLLGADEGNPRGHFEDRDFVRLHEEMLVTTGETWLTGTPGRSSDVRPDLVARAQSLVAARSEIDQWGWKDPRTLLFLDLWDELLPEPRYLFVYRHPVDVVLSLSRRGTELRASPWLFLRSWITHNRALLRFFERHPGRCYLAAVPDLTSDLEGFVQSVAAKLGLALRPNGISRLFHTEELSPSAVEPAARWERLMPDAVALYRALDALADLPTSEDDARRSGRPYTLGGLRDRAAAAQLRLDLRRADARSISASG